MERDLAAFALRDWRAVASSRVAHWAARKREHGPVEAIRAAEALRRQTVALRPGWPTEKDRAEDIATHGRVAACLSLVPRRTR